MLTIDVTQIKVAELSHVPGIMAVCHQNYIANKPNQDKTELAQHGFLLHSFSIPEISNAIEDKHNHIVLVAVAEGEVIGYAWSYNLHKVDAQLANSLIEAIPEEAAWTSKVLYHRHIARTLHHKGVGRELLQQVLHEATTHLYRYVVCKIAHQPFFNERSRQLHEDFGFKQIGFVDETDGIQYGVYLWEV
jgi:GNAT superfamily N-acetyltransferase